jgi:hypothetical protein
MRRAAPLVAVAALAMSGCAARQAAPLLSAVCTGICSAGSNYAPVARLFVSTERVGDSLRVVVDSGMIGVPSLVAGAPGGVLMARLSLSAFVAVQVRAERPEDDPSERVESLRRGHAWRIRAASTKRLVTDSLRYGQVSPIPSTRFDLALPSALDSDAWLGFEITGDAIDPRAKSSARATTAGGVRVYVCDPRTLSGSLDSVRARKLAKAYADAC